MHSIQQAKENPERTVYLFHAITVLCMLVCIQLSLSGCSSSSWVQGDKYSAKYAKKYTPLPIRIPENKLVTMLEKISSLFGIEYRWGGESRGGFDCSGFVQYVYRDTFDAHIPRTSAQLSEYGKKIAPARLRRGDLVFFRIKGGAIDHVGIYLGWDLFAHASKSRGISMGNLNNKYYRTRFAKAVRLLEIIEPEPLQPKHLTRGQDMPD